jgi:hypothetical protein
VLLGTVMKIDNALSPSFTKKYLDAMDGTKYTPDAKYQHHNRGYRFATREHLKDGINPNWILFGEDSGYSVLLSQQVNGGETDLLRVVNLIYQWYSDFVNERFEKEMGANITKKWGLPKSADGYYDSFMTMVSNPVNSNYAMHDDGKPGLCVKDQTDDDGAVIPNKYSKFNLVVPTVCIQNHPKEAAEINFYDKRYGDSDKELAKVICGTVTIHVQLIGVQQNCTHEVSPPVLPL